MIMQYLTFLLIDRSRNVPGDVLEWFPVVVKWAFVYGVPAEIIMAVIWQESTGNKDAIGDSRTAFGLMQVRQIAIDELTQNGYNVRPVPVLNFDDNVKQGTAFLNLLHNRLNDWFETLRAYNCCGTNFSRLKDNPELSKTYADEVMHKAELLGYAK